MNHTAPLWSIVTPQDVGLILTQDVIIAARCRPLIPFTQDVINTRNVITFTQDVGLIKPTNAKCNHVFAKCNNPAVKCNHREM